MLNSSQACIEINGIQTDLLIQPFADRIFVQVTQLGKVGNLVQVSIPSTALLTSSGVSNSSGLALPTPPAAIQLTPLFGSASSEHLRSLHSLYAAQIATLVWCAEGQAPGPDRRSVIVGIALRPSMQTVEEGFDGHERKTFQGIMQALANMLNRVA
ncbi:hypothetical protein BKA82DRAFT_993244 [Pisolithus tinctorius]|uniref:Proteasome assembly chaperone 3 n=1 Tax=Pisolithus tinctorius Marx 270 TaxID=870435 RepID=A0A0C3PWH1_PISTI|nr:hypothetical protein BKA82DRAFT_993244 [Pisolithus tinctorius]KIO13701.1 hypothetical protein M404DRAFT_993244 [Pisolithus tinctorius Marx 270]